MKLNFSFFTIAKRVPQIKPRFDRTALRFALAFTVLATGVPLLMSSGCGGGGKSSSSQDVATRKVGGLSLSVTWPDRSRLIPDASESIVVTVQKAGTTLKTATLKRPAAGEPLTTVANFDDLPVGNDYTVAAAAYPGTNGNGVAQAKSSATVPFVVTDNARTPVGITMDSTVSTITLLPLLNYPLGAGRSRTLTAVGKDAAGNVVMTSGRKVTFGFVEETAGTATLATIDSTSAADATVTVNNAPTTGRVKLTVTATDSESGKSGSIDVYVTATGLATDASWAKFHGDLKNTGRLSQTLTGPTGTASDFFSGATSIVFSSPVVGADGTVYIGAYDNKIRAIAPDGTVRWTVTTGDIVESTPVLSKDGALYVGSGDGKLYAIEAATGTIRFTYQANGTIFGSPVVSKEGIVYFGTTDAGSSVYAVDGLSGELKWRTPRSVEGGVQTTPALTGEGDNEVLYLGTGSGKVYAINASDGTDVYSPFIADDAVLTSSCAIDANGVVYFGTGSGKLYALNADLTPVWSEPFDAGAPIYATPAISADGTTVYFGILDNFSGLNQNKIYAVNTSTGTATWFFDTTDGITASAAIGSDGTIYVPSYDRNLYALNPDGTLKFKTLIGGDTPPDGLAIESSPGFGPDGAIYFGSTDGKVNIVR